MSALALARTAAQVVEATENYARADMVTARFIDRTTDHDHFFYSEDDFWRETMTKTEEYWNLQVSFPEGVISEWIPRVPGLYWMPTSEQYRSLGYSNVDKELNARISALQPIGKSQVVTGGIGTMRLPPTADGFHLVTFNMGQNASAGIPVLLGQEVWNGLTARGLVEGRVVYRISGTWQPIDQWSDRFPSIRGIPRGYVVVTRSNQLEVGENRRPVQIHPYSLMEYHKDGRRLYDFVYATALSIEPNWRSEIESFFDTYSKVNDREGRYLTSADPGKPLWDAEYDSPEKLRRQDRDGRTALDLLNARVRDSLEGTAQTDLLIDSLLRAVTESSDLRELSKDIGIEPALWDQSGAHADQINRFVVKVQAVPHKLEELLLHQRLVGLN